MSVLDLHISRHRTDSHHLPTCAIMYTTHAPQLRSPCRKRPYTQDVPHLSKGPLQLAPALKAPPQGCPNPILGRSVLTYFRYADTYAGRPCLSSLVSRRVRMPTALSALSAMSTTIPHTTRYQNLHPIPVPESHHPGRLESCSPPSAVSHPLGRRPLTPPLDS